MQLWDSVISTAMMGTDKKAVAELEVDETLRYAFQKIQNNPTADKEEKFLHISGLAFNYRRSGALASKKEVNLSPAPAEEKKYCSNESLQTLRDIISEENIPLLNFWLKQCNRCEQIITPALIPVLFSLGANNKKLQSLISSCCGKRGAWLSTFNHEWNFGNTDTPETIWQSGTTEQRKTVLQQIRESNVALGLQWLQHSWQQEDAAVRVAFLEILRPTACEQDISFLESLATDKSKKVKDESLQLLKSITGSSIVRQYQQMLQQSVSLKTEKALLGLTSKTTLQFHLTVTDESIYKTGIDKLSNTKEFKDEEFILMQLTEHVPPSFWEQHLQLDKKEVIEYLQKDGTGKKLFPALVTATVRFKNAGWAKALQQYSETFYIDIIPMLPAEEQDGYCLKFTKEFPDSILQYALQFTSEWSPELATEIFKHTAQNIYQYTKTFYSNCIELIPQQVLPQLGNIKPSQDYYQDHWNNMSAYITKLVQLKQQTLKNFN